MKQEQTFWIVMRFDLPTTITYKHTDEENAKHEARRLAKQTGYKFVVMQSIYAAEVDNIVETTYENLPF